MLNLTIFKKDSFKSITKDLHSLNSRLDHYHPQTPPSLRSVLVDCLSSSSGHGLPQIVKPGHSFLRFTWCLFILVSTLACCFFIHKSISQYREFNVITSTKIKRLSQMDMPLISVCVQNINIEHMILNCSFGADYQPCSGYLAGIPVYNIYAQTLKCFQLNSGTEIKQATGVGYYFGYRLVIYIPDGSLVQFAVTDTNAKVVGSEVTKSLFPGQMTDVSLKKTKQISLGEPFSDCSDLVNYRQVNCIDECFNKALTLICKCEFPLGCRSTGKLNSRCNNLLRSNRTLIVQECNQQCGIECEDIDFDVARVDLTQDMNKSDLMVYRLKASMNFNVSRLSDEELEKKLTRVSFYYDRLEVSEITQTPSMSGLDLVASVGGLLGKKIN
jgi:hypothetical protein